MQKSEKDQDGLNKSCFEEDLIVWVRDTIFDAVASKQFNVCIWKLCSYNLGNQN